MPHTPVPVTASQLMLQRFGSMFEAAEGASQDNEYTYDQNGNMTQDLNRKISSIQYNLLNLPQNMTYSNNRSTTYVYDATGRKLQVEYVNPATTFDYCGNMIYVNGTLDRILVDDGYIEPYEGEMYYSYYLKDHQGNNRVVAYDNGVVDEVNHYYPFGLLFGESEDPETQKFKYNNKEFDRYHGLDMYDYGARFYDPSICRFTTMDPMCEKYYHLSPYIYCLNNPIRYVDKNGKDPGDYFDSIDKVAIDFGRFFNYKSIVERKEYSAYIYKIKINWWNTAYSYTIPKQGEADKSYPSRDGMPKDAEIVGRVHSHGNWDPKYCNDRGDGNEIFSDDDKNVYKSNKIYGYVSTPKGKLLKYDPYEKITTLISNDMPRDPATVNKNQKYIRTYKHFKNTKSSSIRNNWHREKIPRIINK